MQTISSQSFIDEDIVAEKIANEDFEVQVSPAFEVAGEVVRVVMDGHHSLEAARQAGVEPIFVEQDATDNDKISLINQGAFEAFLEVAYVDCDYYNIETGASVW